MDEQRDIQKTESISRFFDAQIVRVNPFGDNRAADRAYRRAERIAAAAHLLTNHIDTEEPLRRAIRQESTVLLSSILGIRDEMRSAQSGEVIQAISSIRHLISLIRMLAISGFASTQNVTAIVEALDELGNFMHASQRTNFSESITISREDLLDVGTLPVRTASISIKDTRDTAVTRGGESVKVVSNEVQSMGSNNGHMTVRQQSILETLKSSGTMGIKDICSNLPEYSEKMIQRELLTLVSEGKVVKTGLKRWSRYSVV
jgi:hypothetical protein